MEGKKRLRIEGPTQSPTPSAYRRPSYPLAGCSPAEPTTISPGEKAIPQGCRRCKINQELPVRKAGKSVAKEWPFFVQRMGSTSDPPEQVDRHEFDSQLEIVDSLRRQQRRKRRAVVIYPSSQWVCHERLPVSPSFSFVGAPLRSEGPTSTRTRGPVVLQATARYQPIPLPTCLLKLFGRP